ncbi:HEAT repeat domain-containing protein [Candidatus Sumerlaeota bacterium]|nr:HEAT repeat domain-containing protein [Candidatus Sumerlaeota bacterium]
MVNSAHIVLLERLEEALQHGKATAASHVFQELVGEAPDLEELGRDIARVLAALYEDFRMGAFVSFASWLGNHPAEEVAEPALASVQPYMDTLAKWRKQLADIAGERMARELREQVRSRDLGAATASAQRIIERGSGDKEQMQMAWHLGSVLGTLDHDRPRAQKVIENLERALGSNVKPALFQAIRQSYQTSQTNLTLSEMGQRELQWNMIHTSTVAELIRSLPGLEATGELLAQDQEKAYRAFHALVAAYFSDEKRFSFLDVARILQEFCPADPRETGPVEGVEDVAFQKMNAAQKLASVRTLRRLGQKDQLAEAVIEAMKQNPSGRAARILLQLMGGLSNPRFAPYLMAALKSEKKESPILGLMIDALGRIGDDKSLSFLEALYADFCRARVIDPPTRRRIGHCLAALGRIARNPSTPPERRAEIVVKTLKTLPDDRPLQQTAVMSLCAYDPASLPREVQRIAIRLIVGGLWTMDARHREAKGDQNQRTELGFREGLVDVLSSMGSGALPMLIEEAEKHVMHYSGAFMAIGETLSKIGDERAEPLIRKMVTNALITDESKIPEQMRETFYDSTQDRNRPLSRDKVIHSLLYAAYNACGEAGRNLLFEIGGRIQKGEFGPIGGETEGFVREMLMRRKLAADDSQREKPLSADDLAAAFAARPRQKDPLKNLIADIRGKGLFGVRVSRRIAAIQEVAARNSQEAVPALVEQLHCREMVIRAAAETALLAILRSNESESLYGVILYDILEMLRKASEARAKVIVSFLGRLQPEREPVKALLLRFVQTESSEKLKNRVADVFRVASVREIATMEAYHQSVQTREKQLSQEGAENEEPDAVGEPKTPVPRPSAERFSETQKLALRQQYFAERRAWIESGKQGPEPRRPPGV